MTAVSSVQSTAVAGMAAAVSRLNVDAQNIVSSQIQPVTPVAPHKLPPAGLTAFDTQQIKEMYYEGDAEVVAGRKAIMGALRLYLDFINLFMFLMQFLGDRR